MMVALPGLFSYLFYSSIYKENPKKYTTHIKETECYFTSFYDHRQKRNRKHFNNYYVMPKQETHIFCKKRILSEHAEEKNTTDSVLLNPFMCNHRL